MSSVQPKSQNNGMHKLRRKVINMTMNIGKQCRNIFRRRKVSQPPGPKYPSPAKLESAGNNASVSSPDPEFAPVRRSTEAAIFQANAEKTEITHDSGARHLSEKVVALPPDQNNRTPESNDLEIRPISDTIPTLDDVPEYTEARNSGKAPERDDLEITPREDLVRAFDRGREQPTHDSSTDNTLQGVTATKPDNAELINNVGAYAQLEDPDSKRTFNRYEEAKRQIKEALKFRCNEWGSFDLPQLETLSEQEGLSALLKEIDKILDSRSQKDSVVNPTKWEKCRNAVVNTFMATSPFVMNVLTITKEGAQIPVLNPYGLLFGGLMLLITVHP
jgi:hypothetical protein